MLGRDENGSAEEKVDLIGDSSSQQTNAPEESLVAPKVSPKKKMALAIAVFALLAVVFGITLGVVVASQEKSDVYYAECRFLQADALNRDSSLEGVVRLSSSREGVRLQYNIDKGLGEQNKVHAVFITDYAADRSKTNPEQARATLGYVYNPNGGPYGCVESSMRRVGDLEGLKVTDSGGKTNIVQGTNRMVMLSGPWSVVGRSIVIYQDPPNCDTYQKENKPPVSDTGTGKILGACTIALTKPDQA